MKTTFYAWFLLTIGIVLQTPFVFAETETRNCKPIPRLPFVIDQSGVYCFNKNLSTTLSSSLNAIVINASNVMLDMNGFTLRGSGPTATSTGGVFTGVFANQRWNITIKNGTIQGFGRGIGIAGSGGHLIENNRVIDNTSFGISVDGLGTIIRNNQVVAIGSTTGTNAFGIVVTGLGVRVLNNDVVKVTGTGGSGVGIDFSALGTDGMAVNNRITQTDNGIIFEGGATGKFRDNLTSSVTIPYTGGTDAGNND